MTRNTRTLAAAALTLGVIAGLAACGEEPTAPTGSADSSADSSAAAPEESESATPDASESASPDSAPSFLSGATQGKGTAGAIVTKVRVGKHADYDRVVIDFEGNKAPEWKANYQRTFSQDGSGDPVKIRGRSGLALILQAAGHDENYEPVYAGPNVARPRLDTLRAWAVTGDFEGQFSLGFALNHKAPYRVFALKNPTRLVVDFQHQG